MYKTIFSVSSLLYAVFIPNISYADDSQAAQKKINRSDSLQHTEQRLNALIKAAANQNLLNIQNENQNGTGIYEKLGTFDKPHQQSTGQDLGQKCGIDVFSFPEEVKIHAYKELQTLKNQALNGQGEIDPINMKALALAYLGLGFGEEAVLASATLESPEKAAILAMANTLMGTAKPEDIALIKAQASCGQSAQIWQDVLDETKAPRTDTQIKDMRDNLAALPDTLQNIIGSRLGLTALRTGDIKTAKALHKTLIKPALKRRGSHQSIKDTDLRFFEAVYAVKSADAKSDGEKKEADIEQKNAAMRTLKTFAQYDNPYRVQALQIISTPQKKGHDEHQEGNLYPGYVQDLDAAAQTYGQHKMGKQALAQKVVYLAQTHALERAVDLAENSFEAGDAYFQDSVIVISGFVHADLKSADTNRQIWALEILMRKADFFAFLTDIEKLNQAGVSACAQLSLPKLAAQIMPMDAWHDLDGDTLTLLALSLGDDLQKQNIANVFPKHILQKPEFKALEIEQAFAQKNPSRAMKLLSGAAKNDSVLNAFVTQSWTAGYWSLVDNSLRTDTGKGQHALAPAAKNLAASLSVNAPLLASPHKAYSIADLTSLQAYLENDLQVFQAYLQADNTQIPHKTQNINQSTKQRTNNG